MTLEIVVFIMVLCCIFQCGIQALYDGWMKGFWPYRLTGGLMLFASLLGLLWVVKVIPLV